MKEPNNKLIITLSIIIVLIGIIAIVFIIKSKPKEENPTYEEIKSVAKEDTLIDELPDDKELEEDKDKKEEDKEKEETPPTKEENKKEEKKEESKKEEKPIQKPEEKPPIVYKYTKDEVKRRLREAYDELATMDTWTSRGGTFLMEFTSTKIIDTDTNKFIATYTYDGSASYTCSYDYLDKTMNCSNFNETLSYIKGICDTAYNDYLNYLETGEIDNEDNEEWEAIYDSIDACYYEIMPREAPNNYDEDFNKILTKADLTIQDLEVLKS